MAESDSRREGSTLQAFNPADHTCSARVQISYNRMQTVAKRSMTHAQELAYIVPMILQRPTAIFEGLRQDDDEDRAGYGWRCYCGQPDRSYRADGREAPPYPEQVYLVFINDDGVAYNWRWEQADPDDPRLPRGHGQRFRSRLL